MTNPQSFSWLPQLSVGDDSISHEDLGYGDHEPTEPASSQGNRPRTPRELLRKMPRRISSMTASAASHNSKAQDSHSTFNHQSDDCKPPARSTPTPTPSSLQVQSPSKEGPVCLQAFDLNPFGLAKPSPTRPVATMMPNSPTSLFSAGGIQKPDDPVLEMEARKALLLQSRRRHSHPPQAMAAAASQKGRRSSVSSNTNGNSSVGPVIGSKCVPLAGWRDGVFLFSGIVMRRDGRYKNGKLAKVAFIRLDNPNGPMDGPGHLMNPIEFGTEMASYEGLKYEHHWKVHRAPVMDFETGRPLVLVRQHQQQPPTGMESTFVGAPSLNQEGPIIGVAHLMGQEGRFHHDASNSFDGYFPYAYTNAPGMPLTSTAQGIRAGDMVTVIVCIQKQEPGVETPTLLRRELQLRVLSVTSFGYVNGVPTTSTDPKNEILSFPSTCVLGVKYGKNWQTTFAPPPPAAASFPQQGFF